MTNLRLCLFVALPTLFAQAPPPPAALPAAPSAEDQAKVIADIREAALSYEGKLADFTCNRTGRLEVAVMEVPGAPVPRPAAPKPSPSAPASILMPNTKSRPQASASVKMPAPKAAPRAATAPLVPKVAPKTGTAVSAATKPAGPVYGAWQTVVMNEDRVLYADHKEGHPAGAGTSPAIAAAGGADAKKEPARLLLETATIGEFNNVLKAVFDEKSRTEFTWKGIVGMRGLPVYSFEYKVAKENSTQELVAGASRLTVGYHGIIYAERYSHRVMTITFDPDVPADFPEQEVERVFDFGQVVIAGQFYLLPLKCQMQAKTTLDMLKEQKAGGKSPMLLARLTTNFLSYHKYTAPPGR